MLKVEYNQIQKYLGYAVANANLDEDVDKETLTSTDYSEYASEASEAVMTQAQIITAMENGNEDLDESAHGVTGETASKAYTWINQLRLVYGRAAGNVSGDGDGTGDVDSFEYKAQQTGNAGYADWVTDAGTMVAKLKLYLDAFNVLSGGTGTGEIGTDGYESQYTEVTGGTSEGDEYTGLCTTPTGGAKAAITLTNAWDTTKTMGLSWATSAETNAEIGDDTGDEEDALSICAMKCSALTHWGNNSTTNLPFVYVASSGNLTSTDSDAVSDSVATMPNTFCLGFEIDVSAG